MVVLADEDDGRLVGGREDHGLVDVTLAGRAVAEVRHGDLVRALVADAQGVADRVQRLRTDDDLERGHAERLRVVSCTLLTAPHADVVSGLRSTGVDDAGLAVAREDVVLRGQCPGGADLRRLLPLARRPQAELTLSLERDAFGVDAAEDHHVAVQGAQLRGIHIGHEGVQPGVHDARSVRGQDALGELQILCGVCDGRDLR